MTTVRDNKGTVPALINLLVLIEDDIAIKVVEPLLPGFVFNKKWVGGMLLNSADSQVQVG
ncbi:MAG: hypothetical protein CMQ40_08695 [Gammaproteobacteria bacterium]|nr:hypothetical protein [Gammaproteobacteria bacterium]